MKGFALALLACAGPVLAQVECPHASEVTAAHLLGLWRAEFTGQGHAGTLLLEKHALYAASVSGTINRNGDRSKLAGDVEDGEFTLEESADGVHIAATWLGEVVEGSCGREIRGTWKAEGDAKERTFVLRKD
ncbi:hypothetical protein [Ramlibacter sp. AN1133]|uniref:hypothetical protein n=1 Tax=Ramlibacter sp. AN1133 TaxID=3133429 RepID=UPI0030C3703D